MPGRISAGTERALKAWKPGKPASQMNALAVKYGISPSTLYRALIRAGILKKG